jgi:hypothetical protein
MKRFVLYLIPVALLLSLPPLAADCTFHCRCSDESLLLSMLAQSTNAGLNTPDQRLKASTETLVELKQIAARSHSDVCSMIQAFYILRTSLGKSTIQQGLTLTENLSLLGLKKNISPVALAKELAYQATYGRPSGN